MKKLLVSLLVVTTLAFSASAQENRSFERKGLKKGMHGDVMKDLNLTEAQKTQLEASRKEMKAKMDEIRQNSSLSEEQKREQMKAVHNAQKAKMESILTADQKAKLAERKKDRGEEGRMRGDRMSDEARQKHEEKRADMKEKLGLTNEQSTRLKELHQSTKSQIDAVKNNTALSDEAKKQQIKQIKENAKTQRKSILTAEQLKKMEEMKKGRIGKGERRKFS